jgi:hypothetical protein
MPEYTWTAYLRDIFVILAAAGLILACGYAALVAWQVYKFARALSVELEPILISAQQSAQTVENTAGFMANRFTTPANTATNTALGMFGLFQLYRQARQSPPSPALPSDATEPAPPAVVATVPPPGDA